MSAGLAALLDDVAVLARAAAASVLPAALLLSELLPWLLTPILMIGGAYLCYEGAEKVWEMVTPHHPHDETPVTAQAPENEEALVGGAIRTDFIL